MRHVLLMALVVGCYRPIPPEGVACNPSGGCPQTLSCIDGVCVSSPPGVDAEVDAARTPQLVAVTTSSTSKTQALHVSIPQVTAGDLLIVAFAIHDATMVTSVVDDEGAALMSAGARAEMASTGSELWDAANSEATTGVTITMAGISGFDVWVVELSGI